MIAFGNILKTKTKFQYLFLRNFSSTAKKFTKDHEWLALDKDIV
jgi:hypothetical protein